MTEMQKQFEEFLKEFRGNSPAKMPASLEYMAWQTWQKAWQASREAVVVALPKFYSERDHLSICITSDVEQALNEAGVGYK